MYLWVYISTAFEILPLFTRTPYAWVFGLQELTRVDCGEYLPAILASCLPASSGSTAAAGHGSGTANGGAALSDTVTCGACAAAVWQQLAERHRMDLQAEALPQDIRDLRDCWYGCNCRTMLHNLHHAERLNHMCTQTRF